MNKYFLHNERLGIPLPAFQFEWDAYSLETQQAILLYWEKIRGAIPDRIAELEQIINYKQNELANESNFERSCQLNHEIAEHASIINDLWLWYRSNQQLSDKKHL